MEGWQAVFRALAATGLAALAVLGLEALGVRPETSRLAGLIVAGALNIHGLAALNGADFLPTCRRVAGEHPP